jgi:hypothetical protein
MTPEERQLVIDLALGRISEDDFLMRFPANPRKQPAYVKQALEDADRSRDAVDAECAMLLGFRFGFPPDTGDILCKLLQADWHMQHENIASALQKLKDPQCVEALYETALKQFAYLDYDESYALAVKCIWALKAIDTPEAIEKLELLAQSDNPIISKNARRRLGWDQEDDS